MAFFVFSVVLPLVLLCAAVICLHSCCCGPRINKKYYIKSLTCHNRDFTWIRMCRSFISNDDVTYLAVPLLLIRLTCNLQAGGRGVFPRRCLSLQYPFME